MELALASLERWDPAESETRPTHKGRANKLEIVTGTDDPLAGL